MPEEDQEDFDNFVATTKGVAQKNVPADAINAASYCSRSADSNYYCKTFGICSPKMECFGNENVPAAPQQQQQQCSSRVQAPMYEYPMSDATKKQYASAMNAALDDVNAPPNAPTPASMRKTDMDNVTGYYDEDLEQYLQTKDMVSAPGMPALKPQKPQPVPGDYDPNASPFAVSMDKLKKQKTPIVSETDLIGEAAVSTVSSHSASATDKFEAWAAKAFFFDIFLFVAAGLLIIMLCDQLFRFGVALGIQETVMLLKPFMDAPAALAAPALAGLDI